MVSHSVNKSNINRGQCNESSMNLVKLPLCSTLNFRGMRQNGVSIELHIKGKQLRIKLIEISCTVAK